MSPPQAGTYTFQVEQTYSDGSIVDWAGSESSAAPAPTIAAKSSLGGGGTSTADDRRARRRRGRRHPRRDRPRRRRRRKAAARMRRPGRGVLVLIVAVIALAAPAAASAHAYLIKTVPLGERRSSTSRPGTSRSPTTRRSSPASRSSRSPTRTATRWRRRRLHRSPADPDTLIVPLQPAAAGGLVPRLLAGDLGRRASGPGRLHLRGRSEPRPGAAVRHPAHRLVGDDAAADRRQAGRSS